MKQALVKLTAVLVVLMLVLSGCNLIAVDRMKELNEEFDKLRKDYSAVVAEYDGGSVTLADVRANYQQQMSYLSMYQQYGINVTQEMIDNAVQASASQGVMEVAINKEFEARGMTLSDDVLAEVKENAETSWKEAYDNYYASAEGDTDEVRAKQTEYNLYSAGYTEENVYNSYLVNAKYDALEEAVEGEITEISDDDLNAAYEEKVSADEAAYSGSARSFESAMTSDTTTVYWMPEGYRTVKHILLIPEDAAVLTAMTDARTAYADAQESLEGLRNELEALNDDDAEGEAEGEEEEKRTPEEIQAEIDTAESTLGELQANVEAAEAAVLASVQTRLDEINEKLAGGTDFEALIEEYGEDPGMKNEPTKTRGYYVSADSTSWDENFKNAAMALEKVGDITETPAIGTSGVHIIRYESDVTPGAIGLDAVRDALYEETLESRKHSHFNDELTAWEEALHPVYHLDVLK